MSTHGKLPRLTTPPVSAPWFDLGLSQARLGIKHRAIVTFDGPSGTGKTTTATVAAAESPIQFRYTKLRLGARTKEVAESLYLAVHTDRDLPARRSERALLEECTETLRVGNIGLFADEVHRIGLAGMFALANIWDTVLQEEGRAFPLFLAGANVEAAIKKAPELDTRIFLRASFAPLERDEIVPVVQAMDQRFAATPVKRLEQFDRLYAKGNLRRWNHFRDFANDNPALAGTEVSIDEVKEYLVRAGVRLKDGLK